MKKRKLTPKSKALMNASVNHRAFNSSLNFEDFLRRNVTDTEREFRLVVREKSPDAVTILCHPLGRDGETYDGYAMRYNIEPKQAIDNLMKYLREKPLTEKLP